MSTETWFCRKCQLLKFLAMSDDNEKSCHHRLKRIHCKEFMFPDLQNCWGKHIQPKWRVLLINCGNATNENSCHHRLPVCSSTMMQIFCCLLQPIVVWIIIIRILQNFQPSSICKNRTAMRKTNQLLSLAGIQRLSKFSTFIYVEIDQYL